MKHPLRLWLFLAGAAGIVCLLICGFEPLRRPSEFRNRYAQQVNSRTFAERNVTDAVTAVNFDYRGFDTIGEEFILFVSVLGSLLLLRIPDDHSEKLLPDAAEPWRDVGPSDATKLWILAMIAPKVAFGVYVVSHGQLTPGGGFQGGVILASAAVIIYIGEQVVVFRKVASHDLIELAEAAGAAAFLAIGMLAWFRGQPFLTNILPLGKAHELTSGGTIPLISVATGLEVAGGFVLLLYAFLQETLTPADTP